MSRPAVFLRDVSVAHSTAVTVLDGVTLDLHPGWTGIVGPNGVGKTTLLRVIAGELRPDTGRVDVTSAVPPVLTPQRVDELSDEVRSFAGDWSGDAARMRSRLELDPDAVRRWSSLSPGERTRWMIAAALAARPDVLLLDEPTNHLDADARDVLVGALESFDGVGLVVSHDRTLLDRLTTSTVRLLGPGDCDHRGGSWSQARVQWRAEADAAAADERRARREEARLRRVRADIRRERQAAEQGAAARLRRAGHRDPDAREAGRKGRAAKAEASLAARVRQVDTRLSRAAAEGHRVVTAPDIGALTVRPGSGRRRVVATLRADELAVGDGLVVLRDVDVAVGRDERIRVVGANGAGKTTLLRAIVAAAPSVGDLPQAAPARDARLALHQVRTLPPDERGRVLGTLAVLGVDPDRLLATDAPSPGEARKLQLAALLVESHDLIVLDEPTTHLDLPAIEALQDALGAFEGALVLVTHDDEFAGAVTTATWIVADGAVTTLDRAAGTERW